MKKKKIIKKVIPIREFYVPTVPANQKRHIFLDIACGWFCYAARSSNYIVSPLSLSQTECIK